MANERRSDGEPNTPPSWSRSRLRSTTSQGSLSPPLNPTLVEVNEWVLPSHCHQHEPTLRHGQLLRWMDIASCLSGETSSLSLHMFCMDVWLIPIPLHNRISHPVVQPGSLKKRLDIRLTGCITGQVVYLCRIYFLCSHSIWVHACKYVYNNYGFSFQMANKGVWTRSINWLHLLVKVLILNQLHLLVRHVT